MSNTIPRVNLTLQFYQASLLVDRSEGKLLLQNWKCFIPASGVFIPLTGNLYCEYAKTTFEMPKEMKRGKGNRDK